MTKTTLAAFDGGVLVELSWEHGCDGCARIIPAGSLVWRGDYYGDPGERDRVTYCLSCGKRGGQVGKA